MADRRKRVKSLIARDVADIINREIKNPKIGMVSVNDVKVSDDYSEAKVYVSFMLAKYPHQNFAELKKCEGFVRSSLAKKVDLYKVPRIVFCYDESFEKAYALEMALRREQEQIDSLPESSEDEE